MIYITHWELNSTKNGSRFLQPKYTTRFRIEISIHSNTGPKTYSVFLNNSSSQRYSRQEMPNDLGSKQNDSQSSLEALDDDDVQEIKKIQQMLNPNEVLVVARQI